ncbi:hypothetical protein COV24_04090 [candidate division WWE3 bacterium CG10_big_fil_rev_8_21_14_0_10_32_10]|uniref:Uncharacterized protein n=1 Tax=candidate division WWE3 bacterium CG10_big_fil_rev_8_21_14_0_10_32_10 TaxID=1975090 RepID=A0A2H0RA30_UNCKA|nr:MAG: hypothetical protein COV24_04090 [candidate division WWE3 bacterium CG10_big_fil_rev_8_21_14_0_10_32_10]
MKQKIIKYKYIFIALIVLTAIVFAGNKFLNKSTIQTSNISVSEEKVKKGNVKSTVSTSGQVQNANYLPVTTSVSGIVKTVYVKEGDEVKKGDKIMEVTLDSEGEKSKSSAYAAYLKAKNSLDSANNSLYSAQSTLTQKESDLDTIKRTTSYQTREEKLAFDLAQDNYLKAKGDLENQQDSINQLKIALNNTWLDYLVQSPTINAPSDGVVANIIYVEGTQIQNSVSERSIQTVASIKQPGSPIAMLNVSEVDINKIKVGQKVELSLNSIPGELFTGIITGIDKIGSVTSGVSNYPVIIKFDKESDQILPNMGVDAEIVIQEKDNVLYVPTSSIVTNNNKTGVNLIKNGNSEFVTIKTGISDNENTEVVEGLSEGDMVSIPSLPTSGFTDSNSANGNSFGGFTGGGGNFIRLR